MVFFSLSNDAHDPFYRVDVHGSASGVNAITLEAMFRCDLRGRLDEATPNPKELP